MAAPPSVIDRFHRAIHGTVADEVDKRMTALASGSAASFDEYRYQVGYLDALTRVLDVCHDIEKEFYGSRPGEGETATGE